MPGRASDPDAVLLDRERGAPKMLRTDVAESGGSNANPNL